jgi:site-specific DNA recombinase
LIAKYCHLPRPFSGKVICDKSGKTYSRKVWNSTDDRLRRVIWRCNGKYGVKGKKGCDSNHIDDRVLYQAFVNAFNAVVENREKYIRKWERDLSDEDMLKRVTAKRFIQIFAKAKPIDQIDLDLYFKLVEKITVCDTGRLIVSLLDGSEVECRFE